MPLLPARHWWMFLVRGLLGIVFGLLALFWPGVTFTVLVLWFGAYALVDGIFALVAGIQRRHLEPRWWALLLEGLLGIAVGLMVFFWPGISAFALLLAIGAWAVVTGIFEIATAIRLRHVIEGEWLLALSGLLSVVFGGLVLARPDAGALAVAWMIGFYALLFGVLLTALGLRMRSEVPRPFSPAAPQPA